MCVERKRMRMRKKNEMIEDSLCSTRGYRYRTRVRGIVRRRGGEEEREGVGREVVRESVVIWGWRVRAVSILVFKEGGIWWSWLCW